MKNDNLYFGDSNLYRVIIPKDIYDDMKSYCNKSYPNETGGVLVGNYSSDQSTANVVKITPPPPNSRGTRYGFKRTNTGVKVFLDSLWEQGLYYIGEWHYHPSAHAVPSSTDIEQMITLAKDGRLKCPEPILVIIGGDLKNAEIFVGVFNKRECILLQQNDY